MIGQDENKEYWKGQDRIGELWITAEKNMDREDSIETIYVGQNRIGKDWICQVQEKKTG